MSLYLLLQICWLVCEIIKTNPLIVVVTINKVNHFLLVVSDFNINFPSIYARDYQDKNPVWQYMGGHNDIPE